MRYVLLLALALLSVPGTAAAQAQAQAQAPRPSQLETRIRSLLSGIVGTIQMQANLAQQSRELFDSLQALPPRVDTLRLVRVDTTYALPLDAVHRVRWAFPSGKGWAWIAVDSAGVTVSRDSIWFDQ